MWQRDGCLTGENLNMTSRAEAPRTCGAWAKTGAHGRECESWVPFTYVSAATRRISDNRRGSGGDPPLAASAPQSNARAASARDRRHGLGGAIFHVYDQCKRDWLGRGNRMAGAVPLTSLAVSLARS